ncbi:hypothetical protein E2C01_091023 [Portunus trituberculatus]|uniref:Uncharacterized protein n=1 Tax=Portunus trituberculatus TaxID=210409 RepID=A0A5B7JRN9_PORTR|nr:hypothetical protein [Portunus trituberculatus]
MLGGITQWQAVIGLRRWLTDNWSGFYVAGWLLIPTTLPPRQIVLVMGKGGRGTGKRGRLGTDGARTEGAGQDKGGICRDREEEAVCWCSSLSDAIHRKQNFYPNKQEVRRLPLFVQDVAGRGREREGEGWDDLLVIFFFLPLLYLL